MRCVALRHWKSLAAKYTRKLNAVERVFETRYKQENISDVTLGPLLFLLYINDLPCSTDCFTRLFADDTHLLINSPELSTLENVMNKDLANVYKWFQANKLHLNSARSNYLIVTSKMNLIPSQI